MPEISIGVKGGKLSFEVNGVVGSGCADLTEGILGKLGQIIDDDKKPEYFESEHEQEQDACQ